MRSRLALLTALTLLYAILPFATRAQDSVAYGLFFYSPSCAHCHIVLDDHWPAIDAEFGDQLQVLFIDVSTEGGSQIMGAALQSMNISSTGVPMLILGDVVLVGSIDIPQHAPEIIREGLAAGGISYPPIPNIDRLFEQALQNTAAADPAPAPATPSLLDDPANIIAIIVLAGLVGSLGLVSLAVSLKDQDNLLQRLQGRSGWWLISIGAGIGFLLSGSLLVGSLDDGLALALSAVVLLIFGIFIMNLVSKPALDLVSSWTTPLMLVAGLLVAGYLAYVEMTLSDATCGIVGNCHAVQQSPYAQMFGVPVGLWGVLGYVAMLAVWVLDRFGGWERTRWLLFALASLGVAFSIYLTFLEPFVIGASCAWCLTSAVIMTLLLWLSVPVQAPNLRKTK